MAVVEERLGTPGVASWGGLKMAGVDGVFDVVSFLKTISSNFGMVLFGSPLAVTVTCEVFLFFSFSN